jgi:hypothetical protein
MQERRVSVDHATINLWVVRYSSLLAEFFHCGKPPMCNSRRMDDRRTLLRAVVDASIEWLDARSPSKAGFCESLLHHHQHEEHLDGGGDHYAEITGDNHPSMLANKGRLPRLSQSPHHAPLQSPQSAGRPTALRSRSRCRSSTRRILPLMVFGSSVANSISRGYL